MEFFKLVLDTFGSVIFVPVIVFILCVSIRIPVKDAFRGALHMGMGLTLFNVIVGALIGAIAPHLTLMVQNTGLNLPGIDIGWGAGASIVFANSIGMFYLVFGILLNFLLFAIKWTDTFQPTDVWNYYHFLFWAAAVQFVTGSFVLALAAATLLNLIVLLFADWIAPALQEYYGFEGVTSTCMYSTNALPFAVLMRLVMKKLKLDKIEFSPEGLKKRLGLFGEPMLLGLIIGILIPIIANFRSLGSMSIWATILQCGISVAAVMVIYPSVSGLFVKGLIPISSKMQQNVQEGKFKRKIFNLSLDPAIFYGEEANLTAGLLLMPIMLFIAIIQPGNRMLPLADLAAIPFGIIAITIVMHGNILEIIITGAIWYGIGQWFNSEILEMFTQAAVNAGIAVESGVLISAWCVGTNPLGYIVYKIFTLPGSVRYIGIVALFVIYVACVLAYKKNKSKWWRAAGASQEFINEKIEFEKTLTEA